jgi:hypothetical protein
MQLPRTAGRFVVSLAGSRSCENQIRVREIRGENRLDDRVFAAIANNVALYESVFRAHGLRFERRERIWHAINPAPAWYSDAISLVPDLTSAEIIDPLAKRPSAGVKDSFADLDLASSGFRELFAATWIHHPVPERIAPRVLTWTLVRSSAAMAEYRRLHGTADSLVDDLLADRDIKLLFGETAGAIQAGVLLNRSGPHVGISNVFVREVEPAAVWADLLSLAAEYFPGSAIVGYESGADLEPALLAGFSPLRPLRIWVK